MSINVEFIQKKLYFATVHLLLAAGISLAVYLALSGYFGKEDRPGVALPFFTGIDSAEETLSKLQTDIISQNWQPERNIFSSAAVAPEQSETETKTDLLETGKYKISLGLIIVKGKKRFCLTNGVLLGEGEGGSHFMVTRIEPDGVWYRIGDKDIHLQVGEIYHYQRTEARGQRSESSRSHAPRAGTNAL